MPNLPTRLRLPTHGEADPAAVILGDRYRVSVLTDRLFRLEWSPTGTFDDRPTQVVVNRGFPVPDFEVEDGASLIVRTSAATLVYDKGPFSMNGLGVSIRQHEGWGGTWAYGQTDGGSWWNSNLGGTARTLDDVDGACPLEPGIFHPRGIVAIDDAASFALADDGWVERRGADAIDLYVFAYGRDHRAGLAAFYALTGDQPLLPRYALGNWWSRYHRYDDAEYRALITRFEAERLPFSVAVVDMDWHLTDAVPREYGSGWTGYTWNRDLFPEPTDFMAWLHDHGLRVSLNLHPADGLRPFEEAYPRLATALGVDPASKRPLTFDAANPEFLLAYLEQVLHPMEDDGVDFWWLDWQQGGISSVAGLDPLWLLNHYHFLDSSRRGGRPLTFSRYAGPGSHRYPVGFSGDTVITWESLAFQPTFTATASNIGFGWWSHDIGGHMRGYKDDELATRWLQLGCFSPVNRLHSTSNEFNGKEPWRFNAMAERVMGDTLRLRHRLLPYLYTMNERAHAGRRPLVEPLYYLDPDRLEAYEDARTFLFGSELLVAPIVTPDDPRLNVGSARTWLPAGVWVDAFTGLVYRGGRRVWLHRPLAGYPVLARAGAILPLQDGLGVQNPDALEVRVYAGASGHLDLYEDDDAAVPRVARTPLAWDWAAGTVTIGPLEGDPEVVPRERAWRVSVVGIAPNTATGLASTYDAPTNTLAVDLGRHPVGEAVVLRLAEPPDVATNDVTELVRAFLDQAEIDFDLKTQVHADVSSATTSGGRMAALAQRELGSALRRVLEEFILAQP